METQGDQPEALVRHGQWSPPYSDGGPGPQRQGQVGRDWDSKNDSVKQSQQRLSISRLAAARACSR